MSQEAIIVTLTFACCATAHFAGMCISAILARQRVKYHSLPAMLGIFSVVLAIVAMFGEDVAKGNPGLLNPYMLWMLVVGTFFQSLYALGFVMPGYLQWGRMFKYSTPIIVLAVTYAAVVFISGGVFNVYSIDELFGKISILDVIWRFSALLMGVYYVLNIIVLPHRLASKTVFPVSVLAYIVVLFMSVVFYLYTGMNYSPRLLCVYMVFFTMLDFFWLCHSIETLIEIVPQPDITMPETIVVENEQPNGAESEGEAGKSEEQSQTDFNELNQQRYMRVQVWMQHNRDAWMSNGFNRDRLCKETGINRQLMLQCMRSQGHNNVHEYITAYRVQELKRLIVRGEVRTASDALIVGFGSVKTARLCFERIERCTIDAYLEGNARQQ